MSRIERTLHNTPQVILNHIYDICFIAYKVYKELERKIKVLGVGMGVDKLLSISKIITKGIQNFRLEFFSQRNLYHSNTHVWLSGKKCKEEILFLIRETFSIFVEN